MDVQIPSDFRRLTDIPCYVNANGDVLRPNGTPAKYRMRNGSTTCRVKFQQVAYEYTRPRWQYIYECGSIARSKGFVPEWGQADVKRGHFRTNLDRDELLRMYREGLSLAEIARRCDVAPNTIKEYLKEQGLNGFWSDYLSRVNAFGIPERVRKATDENGFDVVERISKYKYRLVCRECGAEKVRTFSGDASGRIVCDSCAKRIREIKWWAAPKVQLALIDAKECPSCGMVHFGAGEYCSKQCWPRNKALKRTDHACAECGTMLQDTQAKYCESCIQKHRKETRKKQKQKYGSSLTRARKMTRISGAEYDPSVNLPDLIKRDGGICQICGKPCDDTDKSWGTSGPLHPSIDHVIPLSKGGSHTWQNVQLAHVMCNSKKKDLLESEKLSSAQSTLAESIA